MPSNNRKQNFEAIIKCCKKEMLISDIAKRVDLSGATVRKYVNILISHKVLESSLVPLGRHDRNLRAFKTINLVDDALMQHMCNEITEKSKQENIKYHSKHVVLWDETPAYLTIVKERHVPRDKKKSPKVHIGSSFGLGGW